MIKVRDCPAPQRIEGIAGPVGISPIAGKRKTKISSGGHQALASAFE